MNDRMRVMQRQPRRISITLSYQVHEGLLTRSEEEGRSLSNLCAFLLEEALRDSSRRLLDGMAMTGKSTLAMGDGQLATRRELQTEPWHPRH
jgi:macrodomain Ter protein organizer (MatP/YcbG family)